ncbi:MAG TPA: hypothetical protein VNU68_21275 [Verrucomicrobiae bacterium]|nr:hypothetical protein [Verrucomicrobiae bacterium]
MSRRIPPDPRRELIAQMDRRSAAMLARDLAQSKGQVDIAVVRLAELKAETAVVRPHQICHAARVSGSAWPQETISLYLGRI